MVLLAAFQVEQWFGSPGNGSLLFAAGAAGLSAAAVLLSRAPRFVLYRIRKPAGLTGSSP